MIPIVNWVYKPTNITVGPHGPTCSTLTTQSLQRRGGIFNSNFAGNPWIVGSFHIFHGGFDVTSSMATGTSNLPDIDRHRLPIEFIKVFSASFRTLDLTHTLAFLVNIPIHPQMRTMVLEYLYIKKKNKNSPVLYQM